MDYCSQCTTAILPNSDFCHECGEKHNNSSEKDTQQYLDTFTEAIRWCKIGTQTLIHAMNKITDNILQFKNARRMDGELMHEHTKSMNDFLEGVEKLENGLSSIDKIQSDATSPEIDNPSDEYISHVQKIIISSGHFFDVIDFNIRYTEDGADKSAKLSQFAEMKYPEKAIRNASNFTLDGKNITRRAENLVADCESFISLHNGLFGQSKYRI
jgi:hypothetical protein